MKNISISLIICFGFLSQLTAQIFATPDTTNLFGLLPHQEALVSFGDLDNDGDKDIIIGNDDYPIFYKNIGNPSNPQFDSTDISTIGLSNTLENFIVRLVDIDNDNDLDIFWVGDTLVFIENIGTPTLPQFDLTNAISHPFNMQNNPMGMPYFVDIDNDGDFDFLSRHFNPLVYVENTGTPISPYFDWLNATQSPFGLNTNIHLNPQFIDIDNDGDDDLFTSTYNGDIKFFENIGTNTQAQFDINFVLNPFSIQSYNNEYSFCSFSDIDSDGDIDLMLSGDGPLQYLENLKIVNFIEEIKYNNSKVIKITDVLGRELNEKKNTTLFYLYEDGTVEKKIIIE
jgi:hypothetical protein